MEFDKVADAIWDLHAQAEDDYHGAAKTYEMAIRRLAQAELLLAMLESVKESSVRDALYAFTQKIN